MARRMRQSARASVGVAAGGMFGEGQVGSALASFLGRGTFRVLPLTYIYLPKSSMVYLCSQSVKINYFCSGPIRLDPICPQPRDAACDMAAAQDVRHDTACRVHADACACMSEGHQRG